MLDPAPVLPVTPPLHHIMRKVEDSVSALSVNIPDAPITPSSPLTDDLTGESGVGVSPRSLVSDIFSPESEKHADLSRTDSSYHSMRESELHEHFPHQSIPARDIYSSNT